MPQRRKYSDEFKLKVVEEYRSGLLGGTNALAKKYGVHNSEVVKWVNQYKEHGPAGLASKAGIYDGDFKLYVVEYMHTHSLSAKATAIRFGIVCHSTVLHWERIYYEEGPEALCCCSLLLSMNCSNSLSANCSKCCPIMLGQAAGA